MPRFTLPENPLPLTPVGRLPESVHLFSGDQIRAIEMALITGRPLLVRGEPGSGKSQLARAAAQALGYRFLRAVMDARTESSDLLWHFDRVGRLAKAQIIEALGLKDEAEEVLHEKHFVTPGKLWWSLDWTSASELERGAAMLAEGETAPAGTVLLIDEIDKADTAVPAGLLSVLGEGTFMTPWRTEVARQGAPPLVIITTNEDRVLPDAFVRRCLVLHIMLPREEAELTAWLMERGRAHMDQWPQSDNRPPLGDALLEQAAKLVYTMREEAIRAGVCPPGLAEYIDLLKAVHGWDAVDERETLLRALAPYALAKHHELCSRCAEDHF